MCDEVVLNEFYQDNLAWTCMKCGSNGPFISLHRDFPKGRGWTRWLRCKDCGSDEVENAGFIPEPHSVNPHA